MTMTGGLHQVVSTASAISPKTTTTTSPIGRSSSRSASPLPVQLPLTSASRGNPSATAGSSISKLNSEAITVPTTSATTISKNKEPSFVRRRRTLTDDSASVIAPPITAGKAATSSFCPTSTRGNLLHCRRNVYDDPGCAESPLTPGMAGCYQSSSCPTLPYESISSRFLLEDDEETVVVDNLDKRPSVIGKQEKIQRLLHNVSQEERDLRDLQLIKMYTTKGIGGNGGKKPRPTTNEGSKQPRGRPSKPKSWSVSTNTKTTTAATSSSNNSGGVAALQRRQSLNLYPGYDLVVSDLDTILNTM